MPIRYMNNNPRTIKTFGKKIIANDKFKTVEKSDQSPNLSAREIGKDLAFNRKNIVSTMMEYSESLV